MMINKDNNEQRRMVTIPRSMLTQLATTHQNVVGESGISSLADYLYELCFNCIGRDLLHGWKDDCQDEDDSGRDNAKRLIHGASMMIVDLADKLAKLEAGQDLSLRESEARLFLDNVSNLKRYLLENPTILQDFYEDRLRTSWEYGAPDDAEARVAFAASFARDPSPAFTVLDQLSQLVGAEVIKEAHDIALKPIKSWVYSDGGPDLRHSMADFKAALKNLRTEMIQQQVFSRPQMIEFFLNKSQSILETKHPRGQREDIMCITQFADALGVRQEIEQVKRQRAESRTQRHM